MTTITTEAIQKIAEDSKQSQDGQFSQGSINHQYAARYMEDFLFNYDTIAARVNEPEYAEFCAAAINALRDIQVRDYTMGLINEDNIGTINRAFNYLASVTPSDYSAPVDTLLALTYYELGQEGTAMEILSHVDNNYSLASLLKRVFVNGWPKEEFKNMRQELHPKVVATIFGEED